MYKKGKKKTMTILIIITVTILTALVYYFPLQRVLAEKKYEQYAAQQGVIVSDIKSKTVFKDYKQGGYYINVEYNRDPNHRYQYQYFLIDRKKTGILLNTMYCKIFDNKNNRLDNFTDVIYKPIE